MAEDAPPTVEQFAAHLSLKAELAAEKPRPRVQCGVARGLAAAEALDPALRAELAGILTERLPGPDDQPLWTYSAAAISRVLARHSIRVSDYSICRHRRGACAC